MKDFVLMYDRGHPHLANRVITQIIRKKEHYRGQLINECPWGYL